MSINNIVWTYLCTHFTVLIVIQGRLLAASKKIKRYNSLILYNIYYTLYIFVYHCTQYFSGSVIHSFLHFNSLKSEGILQPTYQTSLSARHQSLTWLSLSVCVNMVVISGSNNWRTVMLPSSVNKTVRDHLKKK